MTFWGGLYRRTEIRSAETTLDEAKAVVDALRDAVGRVLDVGCGDGLHMRILRDLGRDVVGVDFDKSIAPGVCDFGDMRHLPYPDAHFAGAYSLRNTAFGFPDDELPRVWAEMARVLKPGAPLFVTYTDPSWAAAVFETPTTTIIGEAVESAHFADGRMTLERLHGSLHGVLSVRLMGLGELADMAEKVGLRLESTSVRGWERRVRLTRQPSSPKVRVAVLQHADV